MRWSASARRGLSLVYENTTLTIGFLRHACPESRRHSHMKVRVKALLAVSVALSAGLVTVAAVQSPPVTSAPGVTVYKSPT
jgi:hypothetical protein